MTTIRWNGLSQCYEFDTGKIFGGIEPFSNYHGVCGLMHRSLRSNLVRTKKAFLNAEYYIRPDTERKMLPRDISRERKITHELQKNTVSIGFPSEPEYGFRMNLEYHPHNDMVDMRMTIMPEKNVTRFEIFFASYVCEIFDETWTLLRNGDETGELVKLQNRGILNRSFRIARNEDIFNSFADVKNRVVENRFFDIPVLIARNSIDGLALIFMCDPQLTQYLVTQYHGWDTAHDWAFGADLLKGIKVQATARMVCRPFQDINTMLSDIKMLWSEFTREY